MLMILQAFLIFAMGLALLRILCELIPDSWYEDLDTYPCVCPVPRCNDELHNELKGCDNEST